MLARPVQCVFELWAKGRAAKIDSKLHNPILIRLERLVLLLARTRPHTGLTGFEVAYVECSTRSMLLSSPGR
jgi:hypothetical protein